MKSILTGLCVIVALAALVVAFYIGIDWVVDRYERPYYAACREAGGVVVRNGGSLNCASPDGGWIDVR